MSAPESCPCCSGKPYRTCCEPFIQGVEKARLPEQLMRSRYTAYTQCAIDYIFDTMRDNALKGADRQASERWAKRVVWKKLAVIEASEIKDDSVEATVEFAAHYEENGKEKTMREKSVFKKYEGVWYYVDSIKVAPPPVSQRVVKNKIGRNDPCHCGSGKKYKRCHGR